MFHLHLRWAPLGWYLRSSCWLVFSLLLSSSCTDFSFFFSCCNLHDYIERHQGQTASLVKKGEITSRNMQVKERGCSLCGNECKLKRIPNTAAISNLHLDGNVITSLTPRRPAFVWMSFRDLYRWLSRAPKQGSPGCCQPDEKRWKEAACLKKTLKKYA